MGLDQHPQSLIPTQILDVVRGPDQAVLLQSQIPINRLNPAAQVRVVFQQDRMAGHYLRENLHASVKNMEMYAFGKTKTE